MESELPIVINNRVPCIRPSLEAHDNICFLRQHIRDLAFAFISPIRANYCFYHILSLLYMYILHKRRDEPQHLPGYFCDESPVLNLDQRHLVTFCKRRLEVPLDLVHF